jgi:hypothetical protein
LFFIILIYKLRKVDKKEENNGFTTREKELWQRKNDHDAECVVADEGKKPYQK